MNPLPRVALATALVLGLIGCSGRGHQPTSPDNPNSGGSLDLLENPIFDNLASNIEPSGYAMLGGATIKVDADAQTAESLPLRGSSATDDTFMLSLENFFKAKHIQITGVTSTIDDLVVSYVVEHPFPAPADYTLPQNASTNRADLGFSGRLIFLADVASATGNTYFTDVVANTALFRNMDGYIQPKGTLPQTSSMTANAFPFKLLVDEALGATGNRVGITNLSQPKGNYRSVDGWQRANGGLNRNEWTGFDVFHQGQKATNSFTIRKSAMTGGAYSFSTVVLVKYIDPRGGQTGAEKRGNRLPSASGAVQNFVYRMPYGAFDVSKATFRGEAGVGGLQPNDPLSSTTLRFTARDWDARAIATSALDLSLDSSPTTVEAGGPGIPTISVDIPGVTTSAVSLTLSDDDGPIGGDNGVPETGESNDPLYFEGAVLNTAGVGGQVAGTMTGLARITDITNAADRSAYEFPVRPDLSLITDPTQKPAVEIFQRFEVGLGGLVNDPPSATVSLVGGPNPMVQSLGNIVFQLDAEADTESDPVLYDIDVAYSGSFVADVTGVDPAAPVSVIYTGMALNNGGVTNQMLEARVRYYDAAHVGSPIEVILPYEVIPASANTPPTATIALIGGPNPTISSGGVLQFELQAENDAELDTVQYEIMYNYVATFTADAPAFDPAGVIPFVMHTSTPQVNPSPGIKNRTARVRYFDPLRMATPAVVDLAYMLADPGCGVVTQTYNFTGSAQGWVGGEGYNLPNGDLSTGNYGNFSQVTTCTLPAVEAASAGSMSGNYWGCSWDGVPFWGTCGSPADYGSTANYNLVSPLLLVPALCGANTVGVTYNLVMLGRAGATFQVYTSIDEGCNWVAQGAPIAATGAVQVLTDSVQNFTGIAAGNEILVRFQFVDNTAAAYFDPIAAGFVGAWIDNVRMNATSTGAWSPGTPTPPPASIYTESFEGAHGWTNYGYVNFDGAIAEGGSCGFPGPWGGFGACAASYGLATGFAMLSSCDNGVCGQFEDDLAHSSDFNTVSPAFSTTGSTGTTVIELDEIRGATQAPWTTNVYMATNPVMGVGGVWTLVTSYVHTAGEPTGTIKLSVALPPAFQNIASGVRLRVQTTTPVGGAPVCNFDPSNFTVIQTASGFDNIRVGEPAAACP